MQVEKLPKYLLQRSIVLEDKNVLYVPTPKAGCTTFLWWLAEIEGLKKESFYKSPIEQVSPALTIHDMEMWPERCRLLGRAESEIRHILTSEEWERLAIVRNPAERLFSAWQSKLLVREPQFYRKFSGASWFPNEPTCADDILESFHAFVYALSQDGKSAPKDAHWASQVGLLAIDVIPYTKIGRVEEFSEVIGWMAYRTGIATTGDCVGAGRLPRANESVLRYTDAIYDGIESVVEGIYQHDFEYLGYPWPRREGIAMSEWRQSADALAPMLSALIARHERVGTLADLLRGEGEATKGEGGGTNGERVSRRKREGVVSRRLFRNLVPRGIRRCVPVRVRRAILEWLG